MGGLLLLPSLFILYKIIISNQKLVPISVIALIAGILFEVKNITNSWRKVFGSALISLALSFFSFIPGKGERIYNFESRVTVWPWAFVTIFIIMTIATNRKKVTAQLTEGSTLLLSMAVLYWIIDFYSQNSINIFLMILFSIISILILFSSFHAFTKNELTRNNRFALSLWSSIIFLFFAIDNIYRVYQNNSIENSNFIDGSNIAIQYFLLGISSIYMVQNLNMLVGFLPEKKKFFNEEYYKQIQELKDDHVERFSKTQIRRLYSIFCLLFLSVIFFLNYKFKFFPRHVIIWLVFLIFPILINLYEYVLLRKKIVNSNNAN